MVVTTVEATELIEEDERVVVKDSSGLWPGQIYTIEKEDDDICVIVQLDEYPGLEERDRWPILTEAEAVTAVNRARRLEREAASPVPVRKVQKTAAPKRKRNSRGDQTDYKRLALSTAFDARDRFFKEVQERLDSDLEDAFKALHSTIRCKLSQYWRGAVQECKDIRLLEAYSDKHDYKHRAKYGRASRWEKNKKKRPGEPLEGVP